MKTDQKRDCHCYLTSETHLWSSCEKHIQKFF